MHPWAAEFLCSLFADRPAHIGEGGNGHVDRGTRGYEGFHQLIPHEGCIEMRDGRTKLDLGGSKHQNVVICSCPFIENPICAETSNPAEPLQTASIDRRGNPFLIGQVRPRAAKRVILEIARKNIINADSPFSGFEIDCAREAETMRDLVKDDNEQVDGRIDRRHIIDA